MHCPCFFFFNVYLDCQLRKFKGTTWIWALISRGNSQNKQHRDGRYLSSLFVNFLSQLIFLSAAAAHRLSKQILMSDHVFLPPFNIGTHKFPQTMALIFSRLNIYRDLNGSSVQKVPVSVLWATFKLFFHLSSVPQLFRDTHTSMIIFLCLMASPEFWAINVLFEKSNKLASSLNVFLKLLIWRSNPDWKRLLQIQPNE